MTEESRPPNSTRKQIDAVNISTSTAIESGGQARTNVLEIGRIDQRLLSSSCVADADLQFIAEMVRTWVSMRVDMGITSEFLLAYCPVCQCIAALANDFLDSRIDANKLRQGAVNLGRLVQFFPTSRNGKVDNDLRKIVGDSLKKVWQPTERGIWLCAEPELYLSRLVFLQGSKPASRFSDIGKVTVTDQLPPHSRVRITLLSL
jgi:hypothetical protein